ncbi:hypothetical protein GW915_01230 [bacterium]|nr:hypothetical protein [bacterium]
MKRIICLALFTVSSLSFADTEQRLAEMENKVLALEIAVKKKLGDCRLTFKHHNYRHNRCDPGTFARGVDVINDSVVNLECGYYQLQCFYNNEALSPK